MSSPIIIDPKYAEAKVYFDFINAKKHRVYLVKVSFLDAGIFINSITVQPSHKDPTKPWVQPPRYNVKGSWVWPVQINKTKTALWPLIEKLSLAAVDEYVSGIADSSRTTVVSGAFIKEENEFL